MKVYAATYKCRLCGKSFVQTNFSSEYIVRDNMEHLINGTTYNYDCIETKMNMLNTHRCSNGSYGIGDFQGFEITTQN